MFKLIGDNNIFGGVLNQVLVNRGIKEVERFLKPKVSDSIHYSKLYNIGKAVELFEKHKGSTSEFAVVVDSDGD